MKKMRKNNKEGVALVMVLGLLAVLTLLAVAFAIAMRVERMAARNYMNMVKAKHLVRTCLIRAMDDVDSTMHQEVYPDWSTGEDAMASPGTDKCFDILDGEVQRAIPSEVLDDAERVAASGAGWVPIEVDGDQIGRVAYLVVNTSGLLDANLAGGSPEARRESIAELSLDELSDFSGSGSSAAESFYGYRDIDRRYETVQEIAPLNPEVAEVKNLFPFSYDPQRDECFYKANSGGDPAIPRPNPGNLTSPWYDTGSSHKKHPVIFSKDDETAVNGRHPKLGERDAPLTNKFNINSITDYDCYSVPTYQAYSSDTHFMNNYFEPLKNILTDCGFIDFADSEERPLDVTWNIINYLDTDRIPHCGDDIDGDRVAFPYTHTEGGEPLPLINEIVFERTDNNVYKVSIEIWYPFAPIPVRPSDGFLLKAGLYTAYTQDAPMSDMNTIAAGSDILSDTYTYASQQWAIDNMKFGTSQEFLVFDMMLNIPMGGGDSNNMAISRQDPVYFYCQVRKKDGLGGGNIVNPVDDSMGYSNGDESGQGDNSKRALFPLGATNMRNADWGFMAEGRGYSVCDPRSNGQVKYWTTLGKGWTEAINGYDYRPGENTLGSMNANCDAYAEGRSQGVPIYAYNGEMRNIGELGNIFRSNLDDEYNNRDFYYWQTINLMHANEGAKLADALSVRDWKTEQGPRNGLVCINTAQKEVLRALFYDMPIGPTNCGIPEVTLRPMDVELIVEAISSANDKPWASFQDMFTEHGQSESEASFNEGGGYKIGENEVALAIRTAVKNSVNTQLGRDLGAPVADVYKEDPFRKICELITFRQNMFTIALAAQALGPPPPDGTPAQPIAEKRAMATVYRDSYTGRYFIRSFKWIAD